MTGATIDSKSLDQFVRGYLACALWSSNDESTESGGEPFDANYNTDDIAPQCIAGATAECAAFVQANLRDLRHYVRYFSWGTAGHDFWLTRNGHGAGFWDRGLGKRGNRLSGSAKACGTQDVYLGDDKLIYFSGLESIT